MEITTDHASSRYGIPVILDDSGEVMDYALGIQAVREKLNLSTQKLSTACGCSRRTVEAWEKGRVPDAATLNVMSDLLKNPKTKARSRKITIKHTPAKRPARVPVHGVAPAVG
jgi:DNA-binding XRE family transcriptional regulator